MKCLRMMGLALTACLAAAHANAEELTGTLKKVKETGTITIGYRDSSIPFSYLDDSQKPVGFFIAGEWGQDRLRDHELKPTQPVGPGSPERRVHSGCP